MEDCAGRHLANSICAKVSACSYRCKGCGVMRYCSPEHQKAHWTEHKDGCGRLAHQASQAPVLLDFPFPFTKETLHLADTNGITVCSFLENHGLHGGALWRIECECHCTNGASTWGMTEHTSSWCLPSGLCPCTDPDYPAEMLLETWEGYYKWRELPFHSPVALLLHWPLSLYYALCLAASHCFIGKAAHIHYLGPEKELDELDCFFELIALLPDMDIHLDFIGPAVPSSRDGEQLQLNGYAKCLDDDCRCKSSDCNKWDSKGTGKLTIRMWKGLYHDRFSEIAPPDLIFAPNAGIAALPSWRKTIELILDVHLPMMITDYCEEACLLAVRCINSVQPDCLAYPIRVNPFRQPLLPRRKIIDIPMLSNAFLFGICS